MKRLEPDIKEIYDKYNNGDALTDLEIKVGYEHFTKLRNFLDPCGPVFHLAWCEAHRMAMRFGEFIKARSER